MYAHNAFQVAPLNFYFPLILDLGMFSGLET